MTKVQHRNLTETERATIDKITVNTLKKFSSQDEVIEVMNDLLTESERIMIARRLQIMQMLLKGVSLLEIRRKLGVGLDTIEDVHRRLEGKLPSYRARLGTLPKDICPPLDPLSFKALRKKYPVHFLLFNILLEGK